MKSRLVGITALITLVVTILWLVLLIVDTATAGAIDTFDKVLAHIADLQPLYYLTYLNATLTVLAATVFFTALYQSCRQFAPELSSFAMVFVPVYAGINLVVYLSQITVVPELIRLYQLSEYRPAAYIFLQQTVQGWQSSGAAFFNNLAYAVLGIPSILFGIILTRHNSPSRLAGVLLGLSGLACMVGVIGSLIHNQALRNGSLVGGVLFLCAVAPLSALAWSKGS